MNRKKDDNMNINLILKCLLALTKHDNDNNGTKPSIDFVCIEKNIN